MMIIYRVLMTLGALAILVNTAILIWQVQIIMSLNNAYNLLII